MKAPDWWWRADPTLAARLLAPLGSAYGALTATRMARRGAFLGVPVFCVGNLVAGGAGKTPTALALAGLLAGGGSRPAFLSRGYGRSAAGSSRVVRVEPTRHRAAEVGDEPLLLARVAPTFVSTDRRAAGAAAIAGGADVLILDDGLQNPAVAKTWSLAVVDGRVGVGNGLCLPAGPLRAPLGRQWPFVAAVCIIGHGDAGAGIAACAAAAGKPVYAARLEPDAAVIARLRGRRLLAFAGIGRPTKLGDTLRAAGLDVLESRAFPDHHRFSIAECDALCREAATKGAQLVTTAKDAVRLPTDFPATVLPVRLIFEDEVVVTTALADAARDQADRMTPSEASRFSLA